MNKILIALLSLFACLNASDALSPKCSRNDGKEAVVCVDKKLGALMWQDGSVAVQGDFTQAKRYCGELIHGGFDDWRLPNKAEILSITDKSRYEPAINGAFKYIANSSAAYWSATRVESNPDRAWVAIFKRGGDNWSNLANKNFIRCVREVE